MNNQPEEAKIISYVSMLLVEQSFYDVLTHQVSVMILENFMLAAEGLTDPHVSS